MSKGQTYKEDLLRAKHTDIEHELVILNPNKLQLEIEEYNRNDVNVRAQISQISIIEPSEYYKENEHDAIKNSIRIESSNLAVINNKLVEINNLIKKYGDALSAKIEWKAKNLIEIADLDLAQKILKMVDLLEDCDDVQNVTGNYSISDDIADKL